MADIRIESGNPAKPWVNGFCFEQILIKNKSKIAKGRRIAVFKIPEQTCLPLDTVIRLLNLLNQLGDKGYKLKLHFLGKKNVTKGYFDRMGFFELVHDGVKIVPEPPIYSAKKRYNGNSNSLVEIEVINSKEKNTHLPERLAAVIVENIERKTRTLDTKEKSRLTVIFKTIFMELITNIYEHSKSKLDGIVALQVYGGKSPRAEVIICDSGLGMLETIRPTLQTHNAKFERYSDSQLIEKMLNEGITSKNPDEYAGNGLRACFTQASKINSDLTIRLDNSFHRLYKVSEYENPFDSLQSLAGLQPIDGTFICFEIPLNYILS